MLPGQKWIITKSYLKKHSLIFVLEVFLCGTFTQGTVLELFDKGPSRIWWDFIFFFGVGGGAGVWLLCTTLQVLDYPYCWALGSGGRGAVWDLSSGKIVNYFGSNDRWPGWFCFDNFSLFWSSGGFGSLTQMVGKYIGTGPDFWLISIQSSQSQIYGSQRGKLQVEEVCKGTIFYFLQCNLICFRCPVHSLRWQWLSWMQKVETWLALHTLNMERILPIKSQKDFFAQKKLAKWTAKKQKASAFVPQYFITFTPCCSYLQVWHLALE